MLQLQGFFIDLTAPDLGKGFSDLYDTGQFIVRKMLFAEEEHFFLG